MGRLTQSDLNKVRTMWRTHEQSTDGARVTRQQNRRRHMPRVAPVDTFKWARITDYAVVGSIRTHFKGYLVKSIGGGIIDAEAELDIYTFKFPTNKAQDWCTPGIPLNDPVASVVQVAHVPVWSEPDGMSVRAWYAMLTFTGVCGNA